MRTTLNTIITTIIFLGYTIHSNSQVTSLSYLLDYHSESNTIDCNIVINEGFTKSMLDRIQASSQISFVVPTGMSIIIEDRYMPLQGNHNYQGKTPMNWIQNSTILSPICQPQNDFYAFIPKVSPPSFYNDLSVADTVKLFSLLVSDGNLLNVRLFENNIDPTGLEAGMAGGDFRQGFTIGSASDLYKDNVYNYDFIDYELSLEEPEDNNICIGQPMQLIANMEGNWYSENNSVAMVIEENVVQGVEQGSVCFAFHSVDGYFSKTRKYHVLDITDSKCLVTGTDILDDHELSFYPNPADSSLHIDGNIDAEDLMIYSTSGKKMSIFSTKNNNGLYLNTASLDEGMYIIKVGNNKKANRFSISR